MTRIAVSAALIGLAVMAGSATAAVKPPRSGSLYQGKAHHVVLQVSGRSIALVAFSFGCGETKGRISLNTIPLSRSSRGYRFRAVTHGLVSYRDGEPDENGAVRIRGLFTLDARAVRARFRVITPRCGNTGRLRWRATRVRGSAP